MTNELGTAVLKLKTDNSEFDKGVDNAHAKAGVLGLSLDRVSNIAGGMLTRDVIREGFSKFNELIKSTIDAASEDAHVQAQLEAVIKSTAGAAGESVSDLNAQAKAFQDTTTFGHTAVGAVQALLLTFTDIKANILPQATEAVLNMATALGEDTKSASIQLGKALQDPILGVTTLRRVGVQLSDSQQQLVKDFIAAGEKAKAQQVIMTELNKEFGGSAAAQVDTYAGKMAQLGNKFTDVKEEVGFVVQGGLLTLFEFISDHEDDFGNFVDKWSARLAPVGDFVETRVGGIIQEIKAVYNIVSLVTDGIDSIIHGDWKSAWQDAKDIPEQLLKLLVGHVAEAFGSLPNIMIKAVQAGVNGIIDLMNKIPEIKTPGIDLGPLGSVGSQKIFGGFDIGHVDLPTLDLPKADLEGFFNTVKDGAEELATKAKNAKPSVAGLAGAYNDSGEAAKDAGPKFADMIQQMLGSIRGVSSSLFSMPTREVATLQLQADKLQERADMIQMHLQPSIDALSDLKDGITAAADAAKEAIQAQKDSLNAAKDLINATQDALTERGSQLDQIHQSMQDAIKARFEPPKKLTPEEAALARDTAQFNQAKKMVEDQQKAQERQLKTIDALNKSLDKQGKSVDDNTSKETKLIDARIKGYQKEIDAANKQVQNITDQIKLFGEEKKIMQDLLTLADHTLMTENEQADAFTKIREATGRLTQGVLDMVGGIKERLIPGFDNLTKAHGPMDLLDEKAQKAAAALDKVATAAPQADIAKMLKTTIDNIFAPKTNLTLAAHLSTGATSGSSGNSIIGAITAHGDGGYFNKPTLGIFGDPPGGEWLFNQGQLRSLIREIKNPNASSGDVHVHLPNSTIYASTPEEASKSLDNIGLAVMQTRLQRRRGGMR